MKIISISYKFRMIKDIDFQRFFYKKQLDTSFKMRYTARVRFKAADGLPYLNVYNNNIKL